MTIKINKPPTTSSNSPVQQPIEESTTPEDIGIEDIGIEELDLDNL